MGFFSFLGREEFFLLLISAIYWCWNATLGYRITILLMTSVCVNTFFKIIMHQPRPYWYSSEVQALAKEPSFGIPSGHAQSAVVVWGGIAYWINKTWIWIASILIILLISISRIYLGVHFPSDVFVGWMIGVIILVLYIWLEKPVKSWLFRRSLGIQILSILMYSLTLIFAGILAQTLLRDYTLP